MSATGKYEFVSGDNFEGYLVASGVPSEYVAIAKDIKPTITITENGADSFTMNIKTEITNKDVKFRIGEEISDKTPDGRNVKATFTRNGNNKIIQKQSFDNGFNATVDHEFTDKGMNLTYDWNGGSATRVYKRV